MKLVVPGKKTGLVKALRLIPIFFVFVLATGFSAWSPARSKPIVEEILDQTNRFRKAHKLGALSMNEDLNEIAEQHSEDMAKGRVAFGHGGFSLRYDKAKKKIRNFRGFAENVAYGVTTGEEVMGMWKNSPGHRRNLLGNYKYTGIGTAKSRDGRMYYTQVFVR